MKITNQEYFAEVNAIAKAIVQDAMQQTDNNREEAEELIMDTLLHETVDGHQWIIYYGYNLDVYQHSDNQDYYIDNLGADDAGHALKERGLDGLHQALAYWCLYADVDDKINDCLDEYENGLSDHSYDELLELCKEKGLPLTLACIATDEHNLLNTENLGYAAYQEYKEQVKQSIIG